MHGQLAAAFAGLVKGVCPSAECSTYVNTLPSKQHSYFVAPFVVLALVPGLPECAR